MMAGSVGAKTPEVCLWVSQDHPFSMFYGTLCPRNIFYFFKLKEELSQCFLLHLSLPPFFPSCDFLSNISLYLEST